MNFIRTIFIVCVFCFSSCGGSGGGNTVVVGVLNSESGDLKSFGRSITAAIKLAEIEINQLLGDEGANFRLSFVFKDAGTDPAVALVKMQEFLDEGIRFIIGPMSSGEATAIRDFSLKNDMLLISPASTAVSLDLADDLIVRPVGNDSGQAYATAEALRYFSTTFYAPLYRADTFGDSLTTDVGERFEDIGGLFAPGARYEAGTTDYTEFLEQLDVQVEVFEEFSGAGSVGIYVIAFDEINEIFREASRYSRLSSVRWYGSDGTALNASLLENSKTVDFMKSTRMLSPIFAGDIDSSEFKRIRTQIEDSLEERIKPYAVVTYDSVLLLAKTLQSLGTTDSSSIEVRDEMIRISGDINGATGNLKLSSTGDRINGDYELWEILDDGQGGGEWNLRAEFRVPDSGFSDGVFIVR